MVSRAHLAARAMRACLRLALIVGTLSGVVACSDLGEYQLPPDAVYRGTVIGDDGPDCVPGEVCSFIRRGFAAGTTLELDFVPGMATTAPGTITTTGEPCGPTFDATPLLPIQALAHDQLSQYDFPGPARVRNFLYAARPTSGPLAGRDPMVFVSLVRSGEVEVRIIAGSGQSDCAADDCAAFAAGECDYFGVFPLDEAPR